jgi:iron complex outermembrane receptor protein
LNKVLTTAKTWQNFSPRYVLSWTPLDHVLFYASYSEGFRSGNYNPRTTDTTGIGIGPASPEIVKSYEVGWKTDLLDRNLRFNFDLYRELYSNIQQVLTAQGTGVQSLLNAGGAKMQGFEAEVTYRPIRQLELNANAGYLDARYTSFTVAVPGVPNPLGLTIARAPRWTVYSAGTYRQPLPSLGGDLSLRVSYDWRSRQATDLQNSAVSWEQDYRLVNANLAFTRGNWSVSLYGRNLFNVDYWDNRQISVSYVEFGGAPRTFGGRVTYHFE